MDNRLKILSSALELFSSRGYDAVGVQEIAEVSGITKPTLYHYFGNKENLLYELLKFHFDDFLDTIRKKALYKGDITLTLSKIISAYFSFAKDNSKFYRMQLAMYFAPQGSISNKVSKEFNRKQYEIIEELFINAVKSHGNMRGRHSMYGATFIAMINTYIIKSFDENIVLNEEFIYKALHQFLHGIFS